MKKLVALSLLASANIATAQSTLPLSSSNTFLTLQNRVSAIENGTPAKLIGNQYFQNQVCADNLTTFCLASTGTTPYVNFASGDLIQWSPSSSQFEFYVGGTSTPKLTLNASQESFALQSVKNNGPAGNGEGAVALESSHNTSMTGFVSFFQPSGTRQGYVGFGNSAGINIASDTGAVYIKPGNGSVAMSVNKDANGFLQINVNNLPTSCTNEPVGTLYDSNHAILVC